MRIGMSVDWPSRVQVVTELIMDILRALASANLDIRKKTLDITLDLVSPATIWEVVQVLSQSANQPILSSRPDDQSRELAGAQEGGGEDNGRGR